MNNAEFNQIYTNFIRHVFQWTRSLNCEFASLDDWKNKNYNIASNIFGKTLQQRTIRKVKLQQVCHSKWFTHKKTNSSHVACDGWVYRQDKMRKWMRIDVERKPSGKPHSFTPRRMRHSWRAASLAAWHRALVAPNLRIEIATLTSAPSLWNCCENERSSLSCTYGSFQNRVRA